MITKPRSILISRMMLITVNTIREKLFRFVIPVSFP